MELQTTSSSSIQPARPKVTAFRFSETHQFFDPLESEFMSVIQRECRDVILVVRSVYKQSREKHRHLSFTFKTFLAIGKKKKELKIPK